MTVELINNTLIKKLQPTGQSYEVRDSKLKGFLVRVGKSGQSFYAVQYTRGKKISLGSTQILTAAQARERAIKILGDYAAGIDPIEQEKRHRVESITLRSFFENEYKPHAIAYTKSNQKEIFQRLEKHFSHLFDLRLGEVSHEHITKWRINTIKTGTLKANTINRMIASLRPIFKLAIRYGYIKTHPFEGISPLKCPDERVRYLSQQEEKKLYDALDKRDQALREARKRMNQHQMARKYSLYAEKSYFGDHLKPAIILAQKTGLRKSELLRLALQDINFETKMIHVRDSKSGKSRNVPMNNIVLKTLSQWIQQNAYLSSPHIFPSMKNPDKPIQDIKAGWNSLLGKRQPRSLNTPKKPLLLEDFHWHDLRHDFASKLVMAGVDINTVRELLGHSDIKMTLRYAHLAPDHLRKSIAKLDGDAF